MTICDLQVSLDEPIPGGRRFVRFRELDAKGFVHFDFAIGEPSLSVELTLPASSYQEFCETHAVTFLTPEEVEFLDRDATKWRFGFSGVWE